MIIASPSEHSVVIAVMVIKVGVFCFFSFSPKWSQNRSWSVKTRVDITVEGKLLRPLEQKFKTNFGPIHDTSKREIVDLGSGSEEEEKRLKRPETQRSAVV